MLNVMASHLFLEHLTCLLYNCLCWKEKELKVEPELGDWEGNALILFF